MGPDRRMRFEEIYDAYSGLILAYAARRTASITDAAGVVAETFTVAWRRLADVPDGEAARPWLYGVARRVLANQRRGDLRRHRLGESLAAEASSRVAAEGPDGDLADVEAIAAAFGALSEDDRELLSLIGWDGLGRGDIATMLGCSQATVRVRLHRARRRFAEELAAVGMKRSAPGGHQSDRWATARPDPEEV